MLASDGGGVPIHIPVMLDPILQLLEPALSRPGSVFVDLTCGMAGHSYAVGERFPSAQIVGVDQDAQAIAIAREHLAPFAQRVTMVHTRFDDIETICQHAHIDHVDAILADLGLSSLQIDRADRGFSYIHDAPLDMRMDERNTLDAAQIVNTYSVPDLAWIFSQYGEHGAPMRIARAIEQARRIQPLTTSGQLVDVIDQATPAALKKRGGHSAKIIFQALRIEVNQELEALDQMLQRSLSVLTKGGRMAVLSYHSLEDRLVKRSFAAASTDNAPRDLPVVPAQYQAKFSLVTRKALKPDASEKDHNPRATSARLRVIERIRTEDK